MNNKNYILTILGAAVLTTAVYYLLVQLLPVTMLREFQGHLGSLVGWSLSMLTLWATMIVSGLPALFFMKQRGVSKAALIMVAGTLLAFPLSTGMTIAFGPRVWVPAQLLGISLALLAIGVATRSWSRSSLKG